MTLRPREGAGWPAVARSYQERNPAGQEGFEATARACDDWSPGQHESHRLVAQPEGEPGALGLCVDRGCLAGGTEETSQAGSCSFGRTGRALLGALGEVGGRARSWALRAGILPENVASPVLHRWRGCRLVPAHERLGRPAARRRVALSFRRPSPAL